MTPFITLFGFRKVVDAMKTTLDNAPIDPRSGEVSESTVFKTDFLSITFSVVKASIPMFEPEVSEIRWRLQISWLPVSPVFPSSWIQDNFAQALSTFMGVSQNKICVALTDDHICIMYQKLKVALEAELCAGCGSNILPFDLIECYSCMMQLSEADDNKHMCGVCKEVCCAKIEKTTCCQQHIHRVCSNKWGGDCPYCRAPRSVA